MQESIHFRLEDLSKVARRFIKKIGNDRIFLFDGSMGSGKTTLISEICRQLGVADDIGSPTFSLVNEYVTDEGEPVYHFDLYRLESVGEVADMGAEEYFYSGALCFVEWPDRLQDNIPEGSRKVTITENNDGTRTISF